MLQILCGMICMIVVLGFMYSQGDFEARKNRKKSHDGQ